MRSGRWTLTADYGEGSATNKTWPKQPDWFKGAEDIMNIADGLQKVGFKEEEVNKVMGGNWLNFFDRSFGPIS
jgi:membrane dipeptidase